MLMQELTPPTEITGNSTHLTDSGVDWRAYIFICMCSLFLWIPHVCMDLQGLEGFGSLELELLADISHLTWGWEQNLGLLKEQQGHLGSEAPL